jgi:hypothetical protein
VKSESRCFAADSGTAGSRVSVVSVAPARAPFTLSLSFDWSLARSYHISTPLLQEYSLYQFSPLISFPVDLKYALIPIPTVQLIHSSPYSHSRNTCSVVSNTLVCGPIQSEPNPVAFEQSQQLLVSYSQQRTRCLPRPPLPVPLRVPLLPVSTSPELLLE